MDYREQTQAGQLNQGTADKTPVRDRISTNELLVSEINGQLSRLEERLDTILAPVPPATAKTGNQVVPMPTGSHVQCRLQMVNDGMTDACRRIATLIDRIEL